MATSQAPVFYDPAGRRWRRVRRTWLALAVLVTALAAVFIASMLVNPLLPRFNLRPIAALPHPRDIKPKPLTLLPNPGEQKAKRARDELQRALAATKRVIPAQQAAQTSPVPAPAIPNAVSSRPLAIGFYINWDESSYASLKRNLDQLDWVIAEWSHLQDGNENPLATDIDVPALNLIRSTRSQIRIIPMVQNLTKENWDSALLARLMADESSRQRLTSALGFIALPNVWIFQILFPLISPVMDLILVYTLISAGLDRLQQPAQNSFTNLRQVLFYYALFLAIDWLTACFAFLLEKRERLSLLWWLFLQRFCYRQVTYYVMMKSVASAMRGALVGWGKLERKATAEART